MFNRDKTFLFDMFGALYKEAFSEVSQEVSSEFLVERSDEFINRAPRLIKLGVTVLGVWFFVSHRVVYLKPFSRTSMNIALSRVQRWKRSLIGPFRKWVQFYETMYVLHVVKPNVD